MRWFLVELEKKTRLFCWFVILIHCCVLCLDDAIKKLPPSVAATETWIIVLLEHITVPILTAENAFIYDSKKTKTQKWNLSFTCTYYTYIPGK